VSVIDDIKVRFYDEEWEDYGKFTENHHNVSRYYTLAKLQCRILSTV